MPTHLDFHCELCGATARYMSINGRLRCGWFECRPEIDPTEWFRLTGWDRDLFTHVLETVLENEASDVAVYRLVLPDRQNGDHNWIQIGFIAGTITISGDLAPGRVKHDNRGVISRPGQRLSIGWFSRAFSASYLASKFLDQVWVSENAADKCRDLAEEVEHNDTYQAELYELGERAKSVDDADPEEVAGWCRELVRLTDDADNIEGCHGYTRHNLALLTAIQRRFSILWRAAHEAVNANG